MILCHIFRLNIRTDGIDRIMAAYKQTISQNGNLTTKDKIIWKNVRTFQKLMAKKKMNILKMNMEYEKNKAKKYSLSIKRQDVKKKNHLQMYLCLDRKKEELHKSIRRRVAKKIL